MLCRAKHLRNERCVSLWSRRRRLRPLAHSSAAAAASDWPIHSFNRTSRSERPQKQQRRRWHARADYAALLCCCCCCCNKCAWQPTTAPLLYGSAVVAELRPLTGRRARAPGRHCSFSGCEHAQVRVQQQQQQPPTSPTKLTEAPPPPPPATTGCAQQQLRNWRAIDR